MSEQPLISIIIPHRYGREILFRCLTSIFENGYSPFEIILVDNASTDGSVEAAVEAFSGLRVVRAGWNRGYAGGCNYGSLFARGDFLLFFNNDAVLAAQALQRLVEAIQRKPDIAAVQPKILSLSEPQRFDYAGAAGGMIDVFGFPFARGRLFDTLETDTGQYDQACDIFWASGACCLIRRDVWENLGGFDEVFFAHMEEIDLNWRMHLASYRVVFEPGAVVYHEAGSTLASDSPHKLYLNHRNNLLMLLKNLSLARLLWILPARLLLDLGALLYALARGRISHALAILRALAAVPLFTAHILRARRQVRRLRRVDDRSVAQKMYRGSAVLQYFVFGRKTYGSLAGA
ncbi:MAG: glycosyltransferase family 2 protein [candidate division KSB1 bacterium]|nr:glycosyltransferase family 2 protein [candidate division KSB1 bacterium]